jgi:hypothetical protein
LGARFIVAQGGGGEGGKVFRRFLHLFIMPY